MLINIVMVEKSVFGNMFLFLGIYEKNVKNRINTGFFKKVKHHFPITQSICFWGFYMFLGKSGRFWGNFFRFWEHRQSKNK